MVWPGELRENEESKVISVLGELRKNRGGAGCICGRNNEEHSPLVCSRCKMLRDTQVETEGISTNTQFYNIYARAHISDIVDV